MARFRQGDQFYTTDDSHELTWVGNASDAGSPGGMYLSYNQMVIGANVAALGVPAGNGIIGITTDHRIYISSDAEFREILPVVRAVTKAQLDAMPVDDFVDGQLAIVTRVAEPIYTAGYFYETAVGWSTSFTHSSLP